MTSPAEILMIASPTQLQAVSRANFARDTVCLLGLPFDVAGMDEAVDRLRRAALEGNRCFFSTSNLSFAVAAQADVAFRDSVLHSDLNFADGMPLVWLARLLRLPMRERVSGAGLFERLVDHADPPVTVYFFGGPPGAARAASESINRKARGVRCVGFDSPGFGSLDSMSTDEHLARIDASGAQFVVVALGARKGQAWIERNRARLNAPLIGHLGAVVNFVAGSLQRAPRWVQAAGLEWLWRIKEEPDLWRRYWLDGRVFLQLLATRAIPYAAMIRWHEMMGGPLRAVTLSIAEDGDRVTVKLGGTWERARLQQLRACFSERLVVGDIRELHIDLGDVDWIDPSFVALMLTARGSVEHPGLFVVRGCNARVARIFWFNGAEFLVPGPPLNDRSA